MFRKSRIKRLYKVLPFYTDKSNRFEFYYRRNWLDQFDIMVYDVEQNTNRWFMVTAPVFLALLGIDEDKELHTYKKNIEKGAKPRVVNDFLHNKYFTLISHKVAKFNAESVVGRIGEFGPPESREEVLLLKRVASVPEQEYLVLGMDTIEIPFEGIKKFIKIVKKRYFKDVDFKIEEEEENATDKN